MRGEYQRLLGTVGNPLELPPRARRIHLSPTRVDRLLGTTSACAENTLTPRSTSERYWNYLRVRGEYFPSFRTTVPKRELPPRARRIPQLVMTPTGTQGTTSACAENTCCSWSQRRLAGNYLRVRGEYVVICFTSGPGVELPPRARRILTGKPGSVILKGTTSACAENTGKPR